MIKFNDLVIERRIVGDDFHFIMSLQHFLNPVCAGDALGDHDEDSADRHHRVGNDRKVIGEGDDLAGFT